MSKKNIALLFGGRSVEHNISITSAQSIYHALDKSRYEIELVYISLEGHWFSISEHSVFLKAESQQDLQSVKTDSHLVSIIPGESCLQIAGRQKQIDLIYPVLHGPNGEDGRLQGMLEMARIPYVGCDMQSCVMCMDKDLTKRLVSHANILTPRWITISRFDMVKPEFKEIEQALRLPLFIKPAHLGSSLGISKVHNFGEFQDALNEAFLYDHTVVVEEAIVGREIECAVIGNEAPSCAAPGEVIPVDWYDFESKYIDTDAAKVVVPCELNDAEFDRVTQMALQVYHLLRCRGYARLDFFLMANGTLLFNEANPIPGFTPISVFPKAWQHMQKNMTELLNNIIDYAMQRNMLDESLLTFKDEVE